VTGQIYVDNAAPKRIQASAQGFITLITYGVGMLIGSLIAGWVAESKQVMEAGTIVGHDWTAIWLVPAGMSFGVLILFALLFKERANGGKTGAEAIAAS